MAKTAFLVSFNPMTRVVVDVENPEDLTDMEWSEIVRTARHTMLQNTIQDYLCGDTIDEITIDKEMPYNEDDD